MANIELYNEDCMELMKRYPDNYFELAIVDPPYGLGEKLLIGGKKGHLKFSTLYQDNDWVDVAPNDEYFDELFRVSKNQIIWGGNYFKLPPYRCPIVWDKIQPVQNFSATEIAWSSFDQPSKIFKYRLAGFIGEQKIHPTQKPVDLYKWLLSNYARQGDKILDTHGGSMSIAIACHDMGFDLVLSELDKDYFEAGKKRLENHRAQGSLFEPKELVQFQINQ